MISVVSLSSGGLWTYRQVDLSRHAIEHEVQGVLGAGQGGESSGPVGRQGAVVQPSDAPVHPEDPEGVLSQAAAVLHPQSHLLHLPNRKQSSVTHIVLLWMNLKPTLTCRTNNSVDNPDYFSNYTSTVIYLTQRAPVHVGAAQVEMLLIHHQQLGVDDASGHSLQVHLSHLCTWTQNKPYTWSLTIPFNMFDEF